MKAVILDEENANSSLQVGATLQVPLKCACPDNTSANAGAEYLVTYPLAQSDNPDEICKKFNISVSDLWETNHLEPFDAVYPNTTLLVPLKSEPSIDFNAPGSKPPSTSPGFVPTEPVKQSTKSHNFRKCTFQFQLLDFFWFLLL